MFINPLKKINERYFYIILFMIDFCIKLDKLGGCGNFLVNLHSFNLENTYF